MAWRPIGLRCTLRRSCSQPLSRQLGCHASGRAGRSAPAADRAGVVEVTCILRAQPDASSGCPETDGRFPTVPAASGEWVFIRSSVVKESSQPISVLTGDYPEDLVPVEPRMEEVTRILNACTQDNPRAAEELLPLVYDELRRLASSKMAMERAGNTLQPTALVHEAWLRLVGENHSWESRSHFFRVAAEAMRRILIDRARRKKRQKRGAGAEHVPLEGMDIAVDADDEQLLRVNEALEKLAEENKNMAELVKLRYFVGLRVPEAAEVLGISPTTAKRHWAYARAWLVNELRTDQ